MKNETKKEKKKEVTVKKYTLARLMRSENGVNYIKENAGFQNDMIVLDASTEVMNNYDIWEYGVNPNYIDRYVKWVGNALAIARNCTKDRGFVLLVTPDSIVGLHNLLNIINDAGGGLQLSSSTARIVKKSKSETTWILWHDLSTYD